VPARFSNAGRHPAKYTGQTATTIAITPTTLSLSSGSSTLTAVVKDQFGVTMGSLAPDAWHTSNPAAFSVNSSGVVTFVAAGVANITASLTIGGTTITSNICAVTGSGGGYATPDILIFDFETMTAMGPANFTGSPSGQTLTDAYADPKITIIADPTPRATGHVAQYIYNTTPGSSDDKFLAYYGVPTQAYGAHLWTRGKVFIPTRSAPWSSSDNRKLMRINNGWGAGLNGQDVIIRRADSNNLYYTSQQFVNGSQGPGGDLTGYTGSDMANDAWATIELHLRMSSAKDALDGLLELYFNGASTPSFSLTTSMDFNTAAGSGNAGVPIVAWGDQLTPVSASYDDYRYWDDLAISTTRIGP
jgi:hypothetical protein